MFRSQYQVITSSKDIAKTLNIAKLLPLIEEAEAIRVKD